MEKKSRNRVERSRDEFECFQSLGDFFRRLNVGDTGAHLFASRGVGVHGGHALVVLFDRLERIGQFSLALFQTRQAVQSKFLNDTEVIFPTPTRPKGDMCKPC